MKLKLMPFFLGVFTLTLAIAPLAAQACSGGNKDRGTSETNLPAERTQTSVTIEETTFLS